MTPFNIKYCHQERESQLLTTDSDKCHIPYSDETRHRDHTAVSHQVHQVNSRDREARVTPPHYTPPAKVHHK